MPPKRKTVAKPRIRNPRITRARLLEATVGLLAQKGPDALSIKEAARVANVSRGVAYQHFRDREHLMAEAKSWITERLMESSRAAQPSSMGDQVRNIARLVLENPDATSLFLTDALAGRVLDDEHPLSRLMTEMLGAFTTSGVGRRGIDVEVLSTILLGAVASMVMLGHRRGRDDVDALAARFSREFTLMLTQGIFARHP